MPKRIQRSRAKGWRMPDGAVYVGRPTKWGNPFAVGDSVQATIGDPVAVCFSASEAVETYRTLLERPALSVFRAEVVKELRGKDLVCWCALDQPCHADVLLKLANEPDCEANMSDDAHIYLKLGNDHPFDADDAGEVSLGKGDFAIHAARGVVNNLMDRGGIKHGFSDIDENVRVEIIETVAAIIRLAQTRVPEGEKSVTADHLFDVKLAARDRGGRDMLNHLLALNPEAATALAKLKGEEPTREHAEGRLPFDVLFWITTVAEQLGIMPLGDKEEPSNG